MTDEQAAELKMILLGIVGALGGIEDAIRGEKSRPVSKPPSSGKGKR